MTVLEMTVLFGSFKECKAVKSQKRETELEEEPEIKIEEAIPLMERRSIEIGEEAREVIEGEKREEQLSKG